MDPTPPEQPPPPESDDPEPAVPTRDGRRFGAITGRPLRPINPAYTRRMMESLRGTRPWVIFVAVLIFIGATLMILANMAQLVLVNNFGGGIGGGFVILSTCITSFMMTVYIAAGVYLLRYGRHIRSFLNSGVPRFLEEALEAQFKFWRLVGIVLIVTLVIYGLLILILTWSRIAVNLG